ncbi:response regulator transcription factor [Marinobacter sp. OP 3.4]|uniref:response regulator transcription factor n=1 Tax=Marinobacter sp. OP 3.4 TaxID=3076501 RepID=UPI002E1B1654
MGRRKHYYQHLQVELGDTSHLTERRAAVLRLAADGDTTQEIADKLGISPETVVNHLDALKDQLCARNRADLLSQAWMHGILVARHAAMMLVFALCLLAMFPVARVNTRAPIQGRPKTAQMVRINRQEISGVIA